MSKRSLPGRLSLNEKDVIAGLLRDIGGPTALGISIAFDHGDLMAATSHEVDPSQYIEKAPFLRALQASSLLKKYCGPGTTPASVRRANAIQKYINVDQSLGKDFPGIRELMKDHRLAHVLINARSIVARTLGNLSEDDWFARCSFGPGASSSIRGRDVTRVRKYNNFLQVSRTAAQYLDRFLQTDEIYTQKYCVTESVVDITTVPKTSLVDRTIGIEPDWNIFLQKGLGSCIRSRLRRAGIDLNEGYNSSWQINQRAARKGSADGSIATIDLSAASDRIHRSLVRYLLSEDDASSEWFLRLDATRSHVCRIEGRLFPLTKFSSMGNGFTFELQTLIFWALAKASGSKVCMVFGDDITIEADLYDRFTHVLRSLGMVVNEAKSFNTGYYRESCGKHYFAGEDITPFFHRKPIKEQADVYLLANKICRFTARTMFTDFRETSYRRTWRTLYNSIKRPFHIPEGYGDGGFVVPLDIAMSDRRIKFARHYQRGWVFPTLADKPESVKVDGLGLLLVRLNEIGDNSIPKGNREFVRRSLKSTVRGWVPFWNYPQQV